MPARPPPAMRPLLALAILACIAAPLGLPAATATHTRSPCGWWEGVVYGDLQWSTDLMGNPWAFLVQCRDDLPLP